MRASRVIESLAWVAASGTAAVTLTQAARRTLTPLLAMGQALTPLLVVGSVPVMIVGVGRRRMALTALAGVNAVGLAAVVLPARRVAARRRLAPTAVAGSSITIAHANMLFKNHRHASEACDAVMATNADVIALSEVTPAHLHELERHGAGRYPVRISHPKNGSHGFVLWSQLPLDNVVLCRLVRRPGAVAEVRTNSGAVRVILAHPDPPTKRRWLAPWQQSLRAIDELGSSPGPPTVVVADLNATRWHPQFRSMLNGRWQDADELAGRGMSTSWPTLGRVPAFVRLDHALVDDRVAVSAVIDFDVPGSDHRGFVVTVSPAERRTGRV